MSAALHSVLLLISPLGCGAVLLAAAARDIATRSIPNRLPLLLAAIGLVLQSHDGTIGTAALAAGLVFAICTVGWMVGLMGGGDVKLLAGIAFCVPPSAVLTLVTATGLAGGVLGLFYLALRHALPRPVHAGASQRLAARVLRAERWRIGRGSPLPYGVAIAAGGLFTLF